MQLFAWKDATFMQGMSYSLSRSVNALPVAGVAGEAFTLSLW